MIKNLTALALAGALAMLPSVASATVFGTNLIVNGDAEAGLGSTTGNNDVAVPGFTTTGTFTIVKYNIGGGFPVAGNAGVSLGGTNFFAGGQDFAVSTGFQSVDLSSGALIIDAGLTSFNLSALLGGFATQDDNAVLKINFLSDASLILGSASIGGVFSSERGGVTGLLARDASGFVPVGTRSVDIILTMTRLQGTYNDGYADNLSLVLTGSAVPGAVPEPATWALFIGGFGVIGATMRRRAARMSASFA